MLFGPLSLQKVAIMAPVLGHVASSQHFPMFRAKIVFFFVMGPKSQLFKS